MFEICKGCGRSIIPRYCPDCGALVDGHTAVDLSNKCPEPEKALCICIYCAGMSIFTETSLRPLTDEEWKVAMSDPETINALAVVNRLRNEGKVPPP